ncbi:MAG: iron-sulfur cluster assembly accessory protein [Saprospiraceae bacterium]|nr:iron-sulfur cluster assembly accessory protein [Saprospiraceae bacterium]
MNDTIEKVQAPIQISSTAMRELHKILREQNIPDTHGLRVGVKGGGCSGFSYILGFDSNKDNDSVFQLDGMRLFIQKAHALYLLGMEIDYVDGLNNRGFTFNNPNAKETCGCGTSFNA